MRGQTSSEKEDRKYNESNRYYAAQRSRSRTRLPDRIHNKGNDEEQKHPAMIKAGRRARMRWKKKNGLAGTKACDMNEEQKVRNGINTDVFGRNPVIPVCNSGGGV